METEILIAPVISFKRSAAPRGTGLASRAPAANDRTVVGYASVFGNRDELRDIVTLGAFASAIRLFNTGRSRCRFLWNHDSKQPPTAVITELKEVSRNELPSALKTVDPDITGALAVTRRYFGDPFSQRIYEGVSTGAINEMSFAFVPLDYSFENVKGEKIRLLTNIELMDASDVNFGANSATMASLPKGSHVISLAKAQEMKKELVENAARKEQLRQLQYDVRNLPRKPLNKQQWDNQMRLNRAKLETLHLEARLLT